jgi:hypothetical protein
MAFGLVFLTTLVDGDYAFLMIAMKVATNIPLNLEEVVCGIHLLECDTGRQVRCEVYRVTVLKAAPHVREPGPYSGCARSGPAMWRSARRERRGGDISVPI